MEPPFPVIQKVKMETKRKDSCDPERFPQGLLVSKEGGVQNAVVSLEREPLIIRPRINSKMPVLDQKNCSFKPHVLLVRAGARFQVANSDPMDHDVRGFAGAEMLFRFDMGPGAAPVEKIFEKPGIYLIRCGLHTWMHAFVVVVPHSFYAVSDPDGIFVIQDVPPGRHTLKVWHETLGEADVLVEVSKPVEEVRYVFKNPEEKKVV